MSDNIHNTDTHTIRRQVNLFIQDIKDGVLCDYTDKYKELNNTSSSLFKMIDTDIRKEITDGRFDENNQFLFRVESMLSLVENIQSNRISQHDASGLVGTALAKEYIDACKNTEGPER